MGEREGKKQCELKNSSKEPGIIMSHTFIKRHIEPV